MLNGSQSDARCPYRDIRRGGAPFCEKRSQAPSGRDRVRFSERVTVVVQGWRLHRRGYNLRPGTFLSIYAEADESISCSAWLETQTMRPRLCGGRIADEHPSRIGLRAQKQIECDDVRDHQQGHVD